MLVDSPANLVRMSLEVSRRKHSESRSRSSSAAVQRIGGETAAGLVDFHLGSRNAGVIQFKLNQQDGTR